MEQWSLGFRVNVGETFEARYQQVLGSHPVPVDCQADAATAHDVLVTLIAERSIVVPYSVTLQGQFDSDLPADSIQLSVKAEPGDV